MGHVFLGSRASVHLPSGLATAVLQTSFTCRSLLIFAWGPLWLAESLRPLTACLYPVCGRMNGPGGSHQLLTLKKS